MNSSKRLRVGVIFGGRSGEHEVSLASAASVIRALDPEKYEAVPIGITKDGRWLVGTSANKMLPDVLKSGERVWLPPDPTSAALIPLSPTAGQPERRRGRGFPRAARHVWRRRHGAGLARTRRIALRWCRSSWFSRRHGQGRAEAALRGGGPSDRSVRRRAPLGMGARPRERSQVDQEKLPVSGFCEASNSRIVGRDDAREIRARTSRCDRPGRRICAEDHGRTSRHRAGNRSLRAWQ